MSNELCVCVAIPTLNEEENIAKVISTLISSGGDLVSEVLVADGGSKDRTREIVTELAAKDARIQLLDNPGRIQSHGLNIILDRCRAPIFLRADAHCLYSDDYVRQCVRALTSTKAFNVGGCQRFVAKTAVQAGIAIASRSFLGNGGAKYRDPLYTGYADTVFLGCFHTRCLRSLGGYNTNVGPNEDSELNRRLREAFRSDQVANQGAELNARLSERIGSSAVYISNDIRVSYFPRSTLRGLFVQFFRYGRGRSQNLLHHGRLPLRSVIPLLSLVGILLLAVLLSLEVIPIWKWPFTAAISALAALFIVESLRCQYRFSCRGRIREMWRGDPKRIPGLFSCWTLTMIALIIMPLAHSLGMLYQLLRRVIFRQSRW